MSRPPIIATMKPLPFDALEALEFERLTLWLVEREGYERAQHLGQAGSEQGRDVVAFKVTGAGEELWYFQCKRYKRIDAATLKHEIDKYQELAAAEPEKRPDGIVFVTNAVMSARVREDVETYCEERGFRSEFWAHTELDMRVKRHPEVVREFFRAYEQAPLPPSRARHQAPPLPEHFVPRLEETERLRSRLLSTPVREGVLPVTAVHGPPGIGKTTLVAALARTNRELLERFSDGVLWAPLGREPNVSSLLTGWIAALPTHSSPQADPAIASARLTDELWDKACLLVVDDAWSSDHVAWFRTGGSRCHLLVLTTRADVAEHATLHELGPMTPPEAAALLAALLGRPLERSERREALEVAEALGYLPQALVLGAARARTKPWAELLMEVSGEVARLETLEGPRRRREGDARLEAAFNLCLGDVRRTDPQAWEAFAWLGITRENALITPPMAAVLWKVEESDAAELLELLWREALLLPSIPVRISDRSYLAYRLQPLLHRFALTVLTEAPPEGVGIAQPAAHGDFLDRYRQRLNEQPWHCLPDDGYIHAHLTWHMEKAERAADVHALLREETAAGANGWYEACERRGQTASFLAAAARALRMASDDAERQLAGHRPAAALGLEARYALVVSSLSSLPARVPSALLGRLVGEGIWTPEQGLAYARRIPAETGSFMPTADRSTALIALAPHLPDFLKWELGEELRSDRNDGFAAEVLSGLAPHLSGSMLAEALERCAEMESRYDRLIPWARLAARLPDAAAAARELEKVHEAVTEIGDRFVRGMFTARVAPYLPEPLQADTGRGLLADAQVDAAQEWADEFLALARAWLSTPKGLEALRQLFAMWQWQYQGLIQSGHLRLDAREDVVSMSLEEVETWFFEAPEAALNFFKGDRRRAFFIACGSLAPHFLNTFSQRLSDEQFADWLGGRLEPGDFPPSLVADCVFAQILTWLPPRLPPDILEEALRRARAIGDGDIRLQALSLLLPKLAGVARDAAAAEAATLAGALELPAERLRAYGSLAPHLPERELAAAIRLAAAISDPRTRETVTLDTETGATYFKREYRIAAPVEEVVREVHRGRLQGPAPALRFPPETEGGTPPVDSGDADPSGHAAEEPTESQRADLDHWRADAIARLAPHLSPSLLGEALAIARKLAPEAERARAVVALLPRLPADEQRRLTRESLAAIAALPEPEARLRGWAALGAHMSEREWDGALAALEAVPDPAYRLELVQALVPHLPASRLAAAARLTAVIGDAERQDEVIAGCLARIAEEGAPLHTALARAIRNPRDRTWALLDAARGLAPMDRSALLQEALDAARSIPPAEYLMRGQGVIESRATLLVEVARHSDEARREPLLDEAIAVELGTEESDPRGNVELSRMLVEAGDVARARAVAEAISDEIWRWEARIALFPHMSAPQLAEMLDAVEAVGGEENRAILLGKLAYHLPEPLHARALQLFREIPRPQKIYAAGPLGDVLTGKDRDEIVREARELLEGFADEADWIAAATHVFRHFPEPERSETLEAALAKARSVSEPRRQAEALMDLSSWLPTELVEPALEIARSLPDPERRSWAITALAVQAAKVGDTELALVAAGEIEERHHRPYDLQEIAPLLQDDESSWRRMLEIAMQTEGNYVRQDQLVSPSGSSAWPVIWKARAVALGALASYLPVELHAEMYGAWRELVSSLAGSHRRELVTHLALHSVPLRLGGDEACCAIAEAVRDAGRWWQ